MPQTHPPYPPEFRQQMVALLRAGRSPGELAKGFEPSVQTIRNWVAQADRDEGRREDGLTNRGKPPALPGDQKSLTFAAEYDSLPM